MFCMVRCWFVYLWKGREYGLPECLKWPVDISQNVSEVLLPFFSSWYVCFTWMFTLQTLNVYMKLINCILIFPLSYTCLWKHVVCFIVEVLGMVSCLIKCATTEGV